MLYNSDSPRVWASSALTTPIDDDIYDCEGEHSREGGPGACYHCTDVKSEALESTPLVYYLVLSSSQGDEYVYGGPTKRDNGQWVFSLVRCGSREAAAAEAYYASNVNGWNVVFSCVMRHGETFEERNGPVERVDELWKLAEDAEDESVVRVFY